MYEAQQVASEPGANYRESLAVPPLDVPPPEAVDGQDGQHKATLDDLAAASRQTPAAWMAEMIVYWLLDLSKHMRA